MDRKEYLKARIMEGMGKKSGTKPMSDKEKSLAALAHPKDKITHKDVLVGRGVLKKEEVMGEEYVIHKGKHEPGTKSSLGGQTLHGVSVKDVYTDKKEAQAHADAINKGRGYKTGDEKNSLYGGVLYQVSPRKGMKEEVEQVDEGNKENKAKKNTYVANIIKKKLSSQVLPSLKFGRRELKKEEVEQVDIVESLEKPKTIKVTTKNGWNFDGLIKVTGSDYHIVKHPVTGKQYRVDKSGNSIEEEVEQVNEIDRSQPAAGRDSDRPYPTKPIKLTDKQRTSAKLMTRELLKHAKKQLKKEEVEQVDEASYSAKSARAGEDIGKPGKMFAKIAASASKKYGSEERGKKVAGAVLKKLRAKQAK